MRRYLRWPWTPLIVVLVALGIMLGPRAIKAGSDVFNVKGWLIDSDGDMKPKTTATYDIGASNATVAEIYVDTLVVGGDSVTGASQLATPMEDQGTYVQIQGDSDIKLYDIGDIVITRDMDADSYIMENDAQLDNASDGTVTLTEGGDVLSIGFDGDDISFTVSDGSIELIPETDDTEGTIDFMAGGDTDDFVSIVRYGSDTPMIYFSGCNGEIRAEDGTIDFDNDHLTTTGNITTSGALSVGSITGFTSMTLGDDVLSLSTDDTLEWKSNDENSYFLISGHTAKDAVLSMASNDSATAGQQWNLIVDYTDDNFEFFNETTEVLNIASGGNIDMVTGTTLTMGNDEVISNATNKKIQIYSAESPMVLEARSTNTSAGTASVIISADNATDILDSWQLLANDSATGTLVIGCDSTTSETYVAKVTIAGATGNLTTAGSITATGDIDIDGNDLTSAGDLLITPAGTEVHIDGGLDVGGTSAVGDNNLKVGGTTLLVGAVTLTADIDIDGGDITCPADLTITPTGTEVIIMGGLSIGDATQIGDNDLHVATDATIDGATLLTGTVTLTALGVTLDASDGELTITSIGGGNDEDLVFNFDDGTANYVDVSSGTGVTNLDFGTINVDTDGIDLSEGNITNAGDIQLDSLTADSTTITVAAGDHFAMGTAAGSAGTFSIIEGATASDPTFSIDTATNDVTLAQTVGKMTIVAATDIYLDPDGLDIVIGDNADEDYVITIDADTNDFVATWDEDNNDMEITGNLHLGSVVADAVVPDFWILGDADSDGTANTSETLTLTLVGNATPTAATWAFTNTQCAGYTFDDNVTAVGSFIIGSADMDETDLEKLDGITNGTVAANKALVADASLDVDFGTGDIDCTVLVVDSTANVIGTLTVGTPDTAAGNLTLADAGLLTWTDDGGGNTFTVACTAGEDVADVTGGMDISGHLEAQTTANIIGALTVDSASTLTGAVTFGGQTRKVCFLPDDLLLDGTEAPAAATITGGTGNYWRTLQFDSDGVGNDDTIWLQWHVPDGYKAASLKCNLIWTCESAETASDNVTWDGEIIAVASGEAVDANLTGLTAVADTQWAGTADFTYTTQLDLGGVLTIAVDDTMYLKIFVDNSAGDFTDTIDLVLLELEWESTE